MSKHTWLTAPTNAKADRLAAVLSYAYDEFDETDCDLARKLAGYTLERIAQNGIRQWTVEQWAHELLMGAEPEYKFAQREEYALAVIQHREILADRCSIFITMPHDNATGEELRLRTIAAGRLIDGVFTDDEVIVIQVYADWLIEQGDPMGERLMQDWEEYIYF